MKRTSNLNNISSPVIPAKAGIQLLPHLLWVKKLLLSVLLLSTTLTSNAVELITYYHNDLNGSPIAASDESGNLLWREEYKPYGERLLLEEEAGDNHQWYTGKSHDDDTGLTYMGARYYDPVVGRFMATDPVGFIEDNPTSFNRYAYANNNPYKYVDPDGRYADLAIEIPSLALGVHSFSQNYQAGNYGSALVDGIGLIADVILAAIPGAPGGVGLGIKAVREGTELATKGADDIFKAGRTPKASELKKYAEGQGWKPTQTEGGPLKYVDENGIPRVTIKQGSSRAPGSGNPHVELKDATGQRIDPAGNPVTRKSPGNHTPIDYDL